MSVWRAQQEITSVEFTYWLAFLESNPDPDVKRQYETAHIVSTIGSAVSGKAVPIDRSLLKYKPKHSNGIERQSLTEMGWALNQITNRVNKRLKE